MSPAGAVAPRSGRWSNAARPPADPRGTTPTGARAYGRYTVTVIMFVSTMLPKYTFLVIVVIITIHPALNLPQKRTELKPIPIIPNNIAPLPVKTELRKKKGVNIGYPLPVHHHLLLPTQLHVLPATSNVRHSSIHTGVNHIITTNGRIPVYSQTVSHSSTNITHPTNLVPILVPYQHHIVPIHDLSVIPLHRAQKFGQLRAKEKMAEDREDVNRFRTFYGGYGNGLYFGGHGAGHGFYAYGK